MLLEQWLYRVEARVVELGKGLWKPSPTHQTREKVQAAEAELTANREAASECERQAQDLRHQIAVRQERIDRLMRQVQEHIRAGSESAAWPLALELEGLRCEQEEARPLVARLEQAAWSHQFKARQLERQLEDLRLQLEKLQAPPPRPTKRPRR